MYYKAAVSLGLTLIASQIHAATLKGVVVANQEGGSAVARVLVSANGANPRSTNPDGSFTLNFPLKQPGDTVQLAISKGGYVVINWFQLKTRIPKNPDEAAELVTLIICKETEREQWGRSYYRLKSLDGIEAVYERRIKQLEERNQKTAAAMKQLLQERNQARAEAEAASIFVSRLKPGETTDVYAQVMALFVKGDGQGAVELLKQWIKVSANLQTLLDTPPSPSNVALSRLAESLRLMPDPSAGSLKLFETLSPGVDPDHMFYALYAFYLATDDQRWRDEIFAHLLVFARQFLSVPSPEGKALSLFHLRHFVQTKWSTTDRVEFFNRCLAVGESSDLKKTSFPLLKLLDEIVSSKELAAAIRNNKPMVARVVRLCRKGAAAILVKVAPEAFLVFIANELIAHKTDDDLPGWDRRLQLAVDYPPAFERSEFALTIELVTSATAAASGLDFPVDVGDVGVEGYEKTDIVYVSAVKKWWTEHKKEVDYWNSL